MSESAVWRGRLRTIRRCRQQVPQHRRMVRRRPRQTADSDNQLELLRVSQRVHVHREELAVQLTDRSVAALLVRPGLPVPEPLTERGDGLRSLVLVLDVPDRQAVVPDLVGGEGFDRPSYAAHIPRSWSRGPAGFRARLTCRATVPRDRTLPAIAGHRPRGSLGNQRLS